MDRKLQLDLGSEFDNPISRNSEEEGFSAVFVAILIPCPPITEQGFTRIHRLNGMRRSGPVDHSRNFNRASFASWHDAYSGSPPVLRCLPPLAIRALTPLQIWPNFASNAHSTDLFINNLRIAASLPTATRYPRPPLYFLDSPSGTAATLPATQPTPLATATAVSVLASSLAAPAHCLA